MFNYSISASNDLSVLGDIYAYNMLSASSIDVVDPSYGNATFNITDGAGVATCYRLKAKGGATFTDKNQVAVGDTVLVEAKIQNYNGTCEPTQGNVIESTNPNYNAKFNNQQ